MSGMKKCQILIFLGVILLVIAGAVVFMKKNTGDIASDGKNNQMIYLQDQTLYYLKDMRQPEKAMKIAEIPDFDNIYGSYFTEDGNYVYFYGKRVGENYTLNRVKLSKLKANKDNSSYIEEVAAAVREYTIAEDNVIYYINNEDNLVKNTDGEEKVLAQSVNRYVISEDGKKIFYTVFDNTNYRYEFGYVDTESGTDTKLDSEIADFQSFGSTGYFVYTKSEEIDVKDIYVTDGTQQPVCVAKNVYTISDVDTATGMVYYMTRTMERKTLYDFVNDTTGKKKKADLKESLKSQMYNLESYNVYSASMTQEQKEICTGVRNVSVDAQNNLVVYSKDTSGIEKINIEDIESTSDVTAYLDEQLARSAEYYYQIGESGEQALAVSGVAYLSGKGEKDKIVLTQQGDGVAVLFYAAIENGVLSDLQTITETAVETYVNWINGTLYYMQSYDTEKQTAALCKYENGSSTVISEDINLTACVTTDSQIITINDNLTLYDMSGNAVKIAKNAQGYSYLSKDKIVYLSDGALYLYNSKDNKTKIAEDVQAYNIYREQFETDEKEYSVNSY